jgi:hypothetical protein
MRFKKWSFMNLNPKSRSDAVGMATGYVLDDRGVGVRVPIGSRIFSFPQRRPALGLAQPPLQWALETLSLGVKRKGSEAGHSPPTRAEVKKTFIYIYIYSSIRLYDI